MYKVGIYRSHHLDSANLPKLLLFKFKIIRGSYHVKDQVLVNRMASTAAVLSNNSLQTEITSCS